MPVWNARSTARSCFLDSSSTMTRAPASSCQMSTLAMLQLEPQPTILSPGTGSRETPITEELGFEILSNNIVLKIDILLKALRWIFSQKGQRAETQIISTYKSGRTRSRGTGAILSTTGVGRWTWFAAGDPIAADVSARRTTRFWAMRGRGSVRQGCVEAAVE